MLEKDVFALCAGIEEVSYRGTSEEWRKIKKASGNFLIPDAFLHIQCADGESVSYYEKVGRS